MEEGEEGARPMGVDGGRGRDAIRECWGVGSRDRSFVDYVCIERTRTRAWGEKRFDGDDSCAVVQTGWGRIVARRRSASQ